MCWRTTLRIGLYGKSSILLWQQKTLLGSYKCKDNTWDWRVRANKQTDNIIKISTMSPQHTCIALLISWSTATYASMLQEHKKPLFYLRSAWTQLTPSWLSFICTTTSTYTAASICTAASIYTTTANCTATSFFTATSICTTTFIYYRSPVRSFPHSWWCKGITNPVNKLWYCKPLRTCRHGIENLRPWMILGVGGCTAPCWKYVSL